jgi:aminoglycoside/choline kinase family phosphotransferase
MSAAVTVNEDGRRAERVAELAREALGVEVTRVATLAAGLGLRRFFRVETRGRPASLIARWEAEEDAAGRPAGQPPEPPLESIRAHLERADLPVPRSYGRSTHPAIDWLEDLGEQSLCDAANAASRTQREAWVREALAALPRLQALADPGGVEAYRRVLDASLIRYKADLFTRFSLPHGLGREASPAERQAVETAFDAIAGLCAEAPHRLAHRDFQSQNLMLAPGPEPRSLVWIDLQGALLAPPEYDAVCLLRDSYLDLDEAFVAAAAEELRRNLPDAPGRALFELRFAALTVSRKGKDHARFLFAARERGDERYLRYLGRTGRFVHEAAVRAARELPALGPLAELTACLPGDEPCEE